MSSGVVAPVTVLAVEEASLTAKALAAATSKLSDLRTDAEFRNKVLVSMVVAFLIVLTIVSSAYLLNIGNAFYDGKPIPKEMFKHCYSIGIVQMVCSVVCLIAVAGAGIITVVGAAPDAMENPTVATP